jgi:hypothetical protein
MLRFRFCVDLVILAVCLVLGYAGEKAFWASKPYTEWTEKEVEKLLKNSPWSKSIPVGLAMTGSEPGGSGGGRGGGGMPRGGGGIESGGDSGGGGRAGRSGSGGTPSMRAVEVLVTWYSRPIREAMARSITLRNPEPQNEELDGFLKYPDTPYFNILIIGWRGESQGNREEIIERMRKETYLEKKNKQRISLADLIWPARRGQPLVLLFPKETEGKPTLTLEDKEVTLRTTVGQSNIRVGFKLTDMAIKGEPAL